MINDELLSVLACPSTGESLLQAEEQLVSTETLVHYPVINGIPWLLKNPLHSMVDWSVKLNHFNQVLGEEIRLLGNELKRAPTFSQPRLKQLLTAKQTFQQQVTQLVSPILKAKVASKPVYDALSDRPPNTQNLLSYEANLYRDWVWGESENKACVDLVLSHLAHTKPDNLLVLGAGSCRLAYDLHLKLAPNLTLANDINPLLLFAANQIFDQGLTICEFPLHPKHSENVAVSHQIQAKAKPPGFHLLFSDAATPAIKKASMDCVVTPWLIDIQPFELGLFLRAINHYLPVGGQWINFGSLVFNQNRDSHCYTIDEIVDIAKGAGFSMENMHETAMDYLKSPYNAGYRVETVFHWRATKVKDVAADKNPQVLPDWIIMPNLPIPESREINGFSFQHRLFAELTAKVDGKASIESISQQIARTYKIEPGEALSMIKNFFLKLVQKQ